LVRKLIETLLEQGLKFGLDVAGGFLGPAWPVIKPLVEKLFKGLPESISSRYKSSEEAVREAMDAMKERKEDVAKIGEALESAGITPKWTNDVLKGLDRISDDLFLLLAREAQAAATLDNIYKKVMDTSEKKPGKLVINSERLEYVHFLRVDQEFLRGYDLTAGSVMDYAVSQRHAPAGFCLRTFMVFNQGRETAAISRMELKVLNEYDIPEGASFGTLKPVLDPFEELVELTAGGEQYPIFPGKYFSYKADDVDTFRINTVFKGDYGKIQQLQPVIYWADCRGEHISCGTPVFLASHPAPELHLAKQKFGFGV